MAALQCEICGGKLMGKAGGVFECDSCGMEYDKSWVKEKVQEIKGTVKVEGTVQVAGTVKVEGGATKESLLRRGWLLLADYADGVPDMNKRQKILEHFDSILNIDPECAEAYLGKVCAGYRKADYHQLGRSVADGEARYSLRFVDGKNYQNARRFASAELLQELDAMEAELSRLVAEQERVDAARETARQEAEERRRAAQREKEAREAAEQRAEQARRAAEARKEQEYLEKLREEEARQAAEAKLLRRQMAKKKRTRAMIIFGVCVAVLLAAYLALSNLQVQRYHSELVGKSFEGMYSYHGSYVDVREDVRITFVDDTYCNFEVCRVEENNRSTKTYTNVPYTVSGGIFGVYLDWPEGSDPGEGPHYAESLEIKNDNSGLRMFTRNWGSGKSLHLKRVG